MSSNSPITMYELACTHPHLVRDLTDFTKNRVVGKGGAGEVWIGYDTKLQVEYAVKQLKFENLTEKDMKRFVREIHTMAICKNRFLIPINGFTTETPYALMLEFLENGSLDDVIFNPKVSKEFSPTRMNIIAMGIANGMAHLHRKGIIHRDLKPGNVLLDKKYFPRICDFGLARYDDGNQLSKNIGTPVYMAPEMYMAQPYGVKADIFSFGIMLAEMSERKRAYTGFQSAVALCTFVAKDGGRPQLSKQTPSPLQKLIKSCWEHDPSKRPSFDMIFDAFATGKVVFKDAEVEKVKHLGVQMKESENKMESTNQTKNRIFVDIRRILERLKNDDPKHRNDPSIPTFDEIEPEKVEKSMKHSSSHKSSKPSKNDKHLDDEDDEHDHRNKKMIMSKKPVKSSKDEESMSKTQKPKGSSSIPVPPSTTLKNVPPQPVHLQNAPPPINLNQKVNLHQAPPPFKNAPMTQQSSTGLVIPHQVSSPAMPNQFSQPQNPLSSQPGNIYNSQAGSMYNSQSGTMNNPQTAFNTMGGQNMHKVAPPIGSTLISAQQPTYQSNPSILPQQQSQTPQMDPPPEMNPSFPTPMPPPQPLSQAMPIPPLSPGSMLDPSIMNQPSHPQLIYHWNVISKRITSIDFKPFCAYAIYYLARNMPPKIILSMVRALTRIIHNNPEFVDVAVECEVFKSYPFANAEISLNCLDLVAAACLVRPSAINESFFLMFCFLENYFASEMALVYDILIENAQQLSDSVLNFIISRSAIFARTNVATKFISILYNLTKNHPTFFYQNKKLFFQVFHSFSLTKDVQTASCAYNVIGSIYEEGFNLDYPVLLYHMQFPSLVESICSILLRTPSIPVSLLVSKSLIRAAKSSQKASLVIQKYADFSIETANVFLYDLSWTSSPIPSTDDILRIIFLVFKHPQMRPVLSRKEEYCLALRNVLSSKTSNSIVYCVSLMKIANLDAQVVTLYSSRGVFNDLFSLVASIKDDITLQFSIILIEAIMKAAYIPDLKLIVPRLFESVQNRDAFAQHSAIYLAHLSNYPEPMRVMKEIGVVMYFSGDNGQLGQILRQNAMKYP